MIRIEKFSKIKRHKVWPIDREDTVYDASKMMDEKRTVVQLGFYRRHHAICSIADVKGLSYSAGFKEICPYTKQFLTEMHRLNR